jgi:hypothetical protein
MRTISTDVYQYHELSAEAKSKARDWYREASTYDDFYSESVFDDAADIADIMGLDIRQTQSKRMSGEVTHKPTIYFSGFYSQGDGACFEGKYRYKPGALKALIEHAPLDFELHRICEALQKAQKPHFYRLIASIKHRGHYHHSGCMAFDFDYVGDDDRSTEQSESDIIEALTSFADWIYKQLENAYDYQNSDAAIAETIEANEYEFTIEGDRV